MTEGRLNHARGRHVKWQNALIRPRYNGSRTRRTEGGRSFVQALDRSNLSDQQRQAVVEFSRRLNKRYAVAEVVLYGSYARGQGTPGSDIDLLVVLDEPVNRSLREAIYDMAFDLNLEHDTLISVLVVDRDSWNHGPLSVSGIHMAVQEDGIRI